MSLSAMVPLGLGVCPAHWEQQNLEGCVVGHESLVPYPRLVVFDLLLFLSGMAEPLGVEF